MRSLCTSLALATALVQLQAQDAWRQVLSVDPLETKGYFIINPEKAASLGLATLQVEIVADHYSTGGQLESRPLESFTITNGHFGHITKGILQGLEPGETWHYELHGDSELGMPVVEVSSISPGGWVWPEWCRQTCVSNQYAWAVVGYSDGAQTFLELLNARDPATGSAYYFFVPAAEWQTFKSNNPDPSVFGLGEEWSWYEYAAQYGPEQIDVLRLTSLAWGSPAMNGYAIGANYAGQPGWAIRKDRGPWRNLYAWTETMAEPSLICLNLKDYYNGDPLVTANRESFTPDIPELTCMAPSVFGGGLSWGNNAPHPCTEVGTLEVNGAIFTWIISMQDCGTMLGWEDEWGPGGIHGLSIRRWDNPGITIMADVTLPANKDTKLTPFPRIQLDPGLYETTVYLENGHVYRHFEAFEAPIILTADFASFCDINIYPVPVSGGRFSIDFDLEYAAEIEVTIVNNMGTNYHHKLLDFELAGLNKHVVEMQAPWPAGLYHAHFEYADGSSESISFTVEE